MTAPTWLATARGVVLNMQAAEVDGMILDAFTASALVAVWEALGPDARAKFAAMPLPRAAGIAFKLTSKATP